jgi:two-component system, OmpR family, sensor kinase
MSSSPPTESPPTDVSPAHPARWRSPASWSLRTRLIAIVVALLAVLGLVVGATAEVTLHRVLYSQVDRQLASAATRPPPRDLDHEPEDGQRFDPRFVQSPNALSATNTAGTIENIWIFDGSSSPNRDLSPRADATLVRVAVGAKPRNYSLGDGLGTYRLVATQQRDGTVVITGLPMSDTNNTLYLVAGVVGGVIVLMLLAAGWAGAVIIRRTLMPLSRVAATAARVSELKLDEGEVDLAQRVPSADTDARTEVGQVGAALNRMLDHVGSALEARHNSEMQVRQFVADASHELRTPLAAIRGYAELSRRSPEPVPDEVGHVLRRVESEAERMTALVEDLLLLARLDAGRPLAHDRVDLTMLVVDAVGDAHAAGPRHDWQLDLPEEPVTVVGDGARLHQVLANLLANARTHTPEGTTVTVGVSAADDHAVLRVVDGGPGIPAELQPYIFERFARGDSSRSRAAGSTGLGLSIVHAVVIAHGGSVAVASEPGRTEFTVTLPLVPRPSAPADALPEDVAPVVR